MKQSIEERAKQVAEHIIHDNVTIRQAAKDYGYSKSCAHKDISERLPIINPILAQEVKVILDNHTATRHINGGESTRQKYLNLRRD